MASSSDSSVALKSQRQKMVKEELVLVSEVVVGVENRPTVEVVWAIVG